MAMEIEISLDGTTYTLTCEPRPGCVAAMSDAGIVRVPMVGILAAEHDGGTLARAARIGLARRCRKTIADALFTHLADLAERHDDARATRRAGSLPILPARAAAW